MARWETYVVVGAQCTGGMLVGRCRLLETSQSGSTATFLATVLCVHTRRRTNTSTTSTSTQLFGRSSWPTPTVFQTHKSHVRRHCYAGIQYSSCSSTAVDWWLPLLSAFCLDQQHGTPGTACYCTCVAATPSSSVPHQWQHHHASIPAPYCRIAHNLLCVGCDPSFTPCVDAKTCCSGSCEDFRGLGNECE